MALTHILVDFENTQPSAADVAQLRGPDQRLWIFRGPGQRKYDAEFAEALMALGDRVRVVRCEKSGRNALDMHIAFQIGRLLGEVAQGAAQDMAFIVVSRDTDYDPILQYVHGQGFEARREISVGAALGGVVTEKPPARRAKSTRNGAASAVKAPSATPARAAKKAPAKAAKTRGESTKAEGRSAPAASAAPAAKAAKSTRTAKSAAKSGVRTGTSTRGAARRDEPAASAGATVTELADKAIERLHSQPRHRPTRRDRLESWLASHLRSKLSGAAGAVNAVVNEIERRGLIAFDGNKVAYPQWP